MLTTITPKLFRTSLSSRPQRHRPVTSTPSPSIGQPRVRFSNDSTSTPQIKQFKTRRIAFDDGTLFNRLGNLVIPTNARRTIFKTINGESASQNEVIGAINVIRLCASSKSGFSNVKERQLCINFLVLVTSSQQLPHVGKTAEILFNHLTTNKIILTDKVFPKAFPLYHFDTEETRYHEDKE